MLSSFLWTRSLSRTILFKIAALATIFCAGALVFKLWLNRSSLITLKESVMNTQKAIIFDFDGTLADTHATLMGILHNHHKALGCHDLSEEEAQKLRNKPITEICKYLGISSLGLPLFIFRVKRYMGEVIRDIPLFKGIKKVLFDLYNEGYTVGIVSSNTQKNIADFGSASSLFGKDKVLKKALSSYKLNCNSTIYVGDEVRDIIAAKKNNLKMISVTWGFNDAALLKENNPDLLIDKPEQLHKAAHNLLVNKLF
jgi:phosphoglycolate phosphatase